MTDGIGFIDRDGALKFGADQARGQMPKKQRGVHRWIATVMHTLSTEACEAVSRGERFDLDMESMVMVAIGCFDCEMPYPVVKGSPCRAGDEWGDDRGR